MKAITSILATLALAATIHAAEGDAPKKPAEGGKPKMNPEEVFKKLDKDANGSLSKEEFMASPQAKKDEAKATERWTKLDKDANGSVTKEEFTAMGGKKKKDA